MNISRERVYELVQELVGTTKSLNDVLKEDEDLDEVMEAISPYVFWCECCGWACSTDELNNDTGEELCDDCTDDQTG